MHRDRTGMGASTPIQLRRALPDDSDAMLRLSLNWRAWAFAGSLLPRGRGRIVLALAALIATFVVPARHAGASGQCANPIACENLLTGTPESVWDISGSGDPGLQGFATD